MRAPSRMTLPGLVALLAVAAVLMYLEREEGSPPSPESSGTETVAPRSQAEAGSFDYYALVLSWSPTHCESPEGRGDHAQCAPHDGRRYAFILHGLWPQYQRGYPEDCPARTRFVPQSVIDGMLDIMPSKGLIIHEYRKHGTCSGLSPDGYYETARRLFESIAIPERFRNPTTAQFLDPKDVVKAFAEANPKLDSDMIAVACRGPGSRLREVRICFSKDGAPRSCGANEHQERLCRGTRMHVPPVR